MKIILEKTFTKIILNFTKMYTELMIKYHELISIYLAFQILKLVFNSSSIAEEKLNSVFREDYFFLNPNFFYEKLNISPILYLFPFRVFIFFKTIIRIRTTKNDENRVSVNFRE